MLHSLPVSRLAVAVVVLALAGVDCGSLVRHPPYVAQSTAALVLVDAPAPPARVEIVPAAPSSRAVYVDGEWTWRRARWAWLPGRWVEVPAGTAFAPWAFVRSADGRLWYAPGQWRNAAGTPIDPPEPLAIASVETGVVVDAEGVSETTGPTVRRRARPVAAPSASAR